MNQKYTSLVANIGKLPSVTKNAESNMNYKNIKRSNKRPLNTRNNAVKPEFPRTPTFENEPHAKYCLSSTPMCLLKRSIRSI
jgi:hypothetical protein